MVKEIDGKNSWSGGRLAIVVSRFTIKITQSLLDEALRACREHGVEEEEITVIWTPGAFELPLVAKKATETGQYRAVICLGAVIRGATSHYDYVCNQSSAGIQKVALETGIPILFGVLTTENMEQAIERTGIKRESKGYTTAEAAIQMVSVLEQIEQEDAAPLPFSAN